MKKPLLGVIFNSEKRKDTLLLLQDGSQEMDFLLKSLDTTRQSLLPQVRILEEHHLVKHYRDMYELTTIGKLIVDEMKPLINTIEVLDVDIAFWGTRQLDFIPPSLLSRLRELNPCKISEPHITEINQPNKELIETTASSKIMYAVTNIFHPNFMDLFALWAENNVEIHMIFSLNLFKKMIEHNSSQFEKLLDHENNHFYAYSKPFHSLYFAVNDQMVLLATLEKEGLFDEKTVISYSDSARKWTKELFEHYFKGSTPITGI